MTPWLGQAGLVFGAVLASVGVLAGLAGRRGGGWGRAARVVVLGQALAVGSACLVLASAFLRDDMSIRTVVMHSERALPVVYKLAAVWAGQEGSLLLWAFLLAVAGAVAGRRAAAGEGAGAIALSVHSALVLFFVVLMLGAANPFAREPGVGMQDGVGLSPMLQHWAMAAHPPLLFSGYACAAGAFAAVVGGLGAGGLTAGTLGEVRKWALGSWVLLTAGILLGAWWAYVELGWGGYWAWDPVENASLMPWLAMTGLMHALLVARERGVMRGWVGVLACLGFSLCVLGTTLTRSGLLVSMHAFGATTVGGPLLGLLLVVVVGSAWLLWVRRGMVRSEREIGGVLSRDGAVFLLHLLLSGMLVATLAGTLAPVATGLVSGQQISVGAPYYNRVVGSLGLAAALLTALAPALGYGEATGVRARRTAAGAMALGGLGGGVAAIAGVLHPAALVCVVIGVVTPSLIGAALAQEVRARRCRGGAWGAALWGALAAHRRRYAGQLAHAGVCVLVIGVCGSGLYADRSECAIGEGEEVGIGDWMLDYRGLREVRGPNYSALEAVLGVRGPGGGAELRPQRRYYDRAMDPMSEVAVCRRFSGDLYVLLAGWSPGGERAAFVVVNNPLVSWVWFGGGMMVAGGMLAFPSRGRQGANNVVGSPPVSEAGGEAPRDRIDEPREGSTRPCA